MIKKLLLSLALLSTLTSHAAIVLYGKIENSECVIRDSKAVTTVNYQKGQLSLTTAKSVLIKGLDATARQALASATEREVMSAIAFTVEVDGVKANLRLEDSPEAGSLIGLITKACF